MILQNDKAQKPSHQSFAMIFIGGRSNLSGNVCGRNFFCPQRTNLYLNQIFFGNQSYGVEAAAQFYFEHSANELNLPESALLAGVIAAPALYNPVRTGDDTLTSYNERRDSTFRRMDFVISRMQQVGCLTFQAGAQPFCVDANVVRQAAVQKACCSMPRRDRLSACPTVPTSTAPTA